LGSFGISLGFGDQTVSEVCESENVDTNKGVGVELAELAASSRNNGSKDLKVSLGVGKYE